MTGKQWLALAGIAIAAFVFNSSEFMPVGLLTDIGHTFGTSEATTGMLVSVYAWAVMILSVPLMIVASVPLYNIFSVLVLTVTAPDAQQADHRGLVGKTLRGIITNPIILGIFAGLPFSLLAIDFPPMLDKGLSMLGNCATPMALLSIGAGFEGAKAIKKLGPTCAAVFIKLVLLSAIFLPMGVALGFREQTLVAIVILGGAPSTASGYVMAKNMGGDHVLSSSIIVLSTALSAVTLTLTLFILRSMALI